MDKKILDMKSDWGELTFGTNEFLAFTVSLFIPLGFVEATIEWPNGFRGTLPTHAEAFLPSKAREVALRINRTVPVLLALRAPPPPPCVLALTVNEQGRRKDAALHRRYHALAHAANRHPGGSLRSHPRSP